MDGEPALGVTEAMIAAAEAALGLRFPETLREAWKHYNCNEMRGGWRVFPVFDPANPRKTCGSVTYENLTGVWGRQVMSEGLVSIADNGTGNQRVLKVEDGKAGDQVFHWHHLTRRLSAWRPGLAAIATQAAASREGVLRLRQQFGARAGRGKPR